MIADIGLPDFETRKAILETKASEKKLSLEKEIIDYIAVNIQKNIRKLEGALNRLLAFAELENQEINLETAKKALGEIIQPKTKTISPEKIVESVCQFYNIPQDNLIKQGRSKYIVLPRQITMYLLRTEMNYSFPRIANFLNKKDHTTVIYGCKKIEIQAQNSPNLQSDLAKIKEILYSY